ncbi:unnamed protein product [Polarella glacialis]|uniref:Ubiquitin conjugation factor E4 core domain-containing protein n=1 Tax=Polarella glacialis TaxID=89957 RepID=A0A813KDJ0_POLGL|nr:unnamed protein product [Polarella glacialis]
MLDKSQLSPHFLLSMADAVEDEELLPTIFGPVLTHACRRLQGRNFVDQKLEELGWITAICAAKGPLARLLVTLPIFRPKEQSATPAMPNFMAMMGGGASGSRGPQQPGMGYRLQTESLLGWVLCPTILDTGLYKEKSSRQIHFQGLSRKTRPAVQQVQSLLKHGMTEVLRQGSCLVAPLLRTDEAARHCVIAWYGALVTGTECRTKSACTLDQGQGPNGFIDTLNSPMPQQSNIDMRLQMQAMQAQMQGFATPGMGVNVFWSILELVRPIKLAQAHTLDPFYILQEGPQHAEVLGGFVKEARFGDNEEVEEAKKTAGSREAPKFTTQIFWLALRALHVLFVPVLKEELCMAVAAGYFQGKDVAKMEAALGEHFLHEVIFDSSNFLSDLGTLLNLSIAFCLGAAFPDKAAEIAAGKFQGSVLTEQVSPQWNVLPSCLMEDLIEVLEYCINIKPKGQPTSEIFQHVDANMLLLLVTFMLGNGNHVKNPNLRGKATTILMSLAKQPNYRHLLETSPVLANDIIPGCIRVFTAVEKTKQSYYDIRMQLKYQLRIPIMELLEQVLPIEAHKKALKSFAVERSDEFLKFLNQMCAHHVFFHKQQTLNMQLLLYVIVTCVLCRCE